MERKYQKSEHELPLTPRVSGKVMEYYSKFGKDRNLEKFMRLYSPATSTSTSTSHDSPKTQNKVTGMRDAKKGANSNDNNVLKLGSDYHRRECNILGSHSMPNISNLREERQYSVKTNVTVPIVISKSKEKDQTPEKDIELKKTISPPLSAKKAHKRLEWDSLGDVGYKKSASTLNLTHLERSLLQAFFKQTDNASQPSTSKAAALRIRNLLQKSADNTKSTMSPLASSTLLLQNKPKMISQGTHITEMEKIENYCQTSLIKLPQMCSKEIQVNLSSSNSLMTSTTTPSSLEYKSKLSTKSCSCCSLNSKRDDLKLKDVGVTSSLGELLANRRTLGEKNHQQDQIKISQLKSAHAEPLAAINDKENKCRSQSNNSSQLSSSLSSSTAELNLGIQLICSLINAETLSTKHKKHLVRDIVKRILRVGGGEEKQLSPFPKQSQTKAGSSGISTDSVTPAIPLRHRTSVSNIGMPGSRQIHNEPTGHITPIQTGILLFSNKNSTTHKTEKSTSSDLLAEDSLIEVIVYRKPSLKKLHNETDQISSTTSSLTDENIQQNPTKPIPRESAGGFEETNPTPIRTTDYNEGELKKKSIKPNTAHFSIDTTISEWLNPITKSEIEYEQRKHTKNEAKKSASQDSREKDKQWNRRRNSLKQRCGRIQQLNWIENEIKRLECLKYLLLRESTDTVSQITSSFSGEEDGQSITTEKHSSLPEAMYDSVNSDQSDTSKSESKKSGVKINEIEVIIEESNEDLINLNENLQRTKERKRETHLIYENPRKNGDFINNNQPKFRSMRETTTIAEEQILGEISNGNEQKNHRERIDTPSPKNDDYKNRDSLKNVVKQRKQEFIELYNHKKRQQNYAISKLKRRQLQRPDCDKLMNHAEQKYSKTKTFQEKVNKTCTNSIKNDAAETENSHSTESDAIQLQSKITSGSTCTTTSSLVDTVSSTSTPLTTQSSISSSIATPPPNENVVDSNNGIAVQTNDSVLRSMPIYGPQLNTNKVHLNPPKTYRADKTVSSTAGIQVKPKGIAYVIEFNGEYKTTALNNTRKDDLKTINSKSDIVASASTTTYTTNNIKKYNKDNPEAQILTLQEHLEKSKSKFIERYRKRQEVLQRMREMQQIRNYQLRQIIDNASLNSLEKHVKSLPPPPTERVRILNTKQMKALTHKRFTKLPEVVAKKQREYEEKRRLNNRKLRDLFNLRLQERVRNGKTSLNHSKTVI